MPYLDDHGVRRSVLLPATAFLEMARAAARELFGPSGYVIEDVKLLKACFLPEAQQVPVQTAFQPDDAFFAIASRSPDGDRAWVTHATGALRTGPQEPPATNFSPDEVRQRCPDEVAQADYYARLARMGLNYGPTFQGIERLWQGQFEALGRVTAPEAIAAQTEDYQLHPAILDACLQVLCGAAPEDPEATGRQGLYLPVEVEQVRVFGRTGRQLWSHARLVEKTHQGIVAEVDVYDDAGRPVVQVRGLRCQAVGGGQENLEELLYEYRWQLRPRPGQVCERRGFGHLESLAPLAARTQAAAADLERQAGIRARYERLEPGLNEVCVGLVWEAFRSGGDFRPGGLFTEDALAERVGIVAGHRRLVRRYLAMLEQDGVLARAGDAWEVRRIPDSGRVQEKWRELLLHQPSFYAELCLVGRCGSRLAEVLRGEVNAVQLIFPDGSMTTAEHLYQDSPSARFANAVAQHAIRNAVESMPAGRTLRVLEIGAGTGGLTSHVLPWLPAGRTEYVFTDLSNHFFNKAQEKLRDYPFVRYQKLDIEKDPREQEFAEHSFDLVIASQVLHATTDLRQSLGHVRQLLASEGLLVLLEAVQSARWFDLVFGLTEGWWRCSDTDLRPDYPLLGWAGWKALLAEVGFTDAVDAADEKGGEKGTSVVLARGPVLEAEAPAPAVPAPADQPAAWLVFSDRGGTGQRLAAELQQRGQECRLVFAGASNGASGSPWHIDPNCRDDFDRLAREAVGPDGPPLRGVVHLWGLDAPAAEGLATAEVEAAVRPLVMGVIHFVQAWQQAGHAASPRTWLVTQGVHSVGPAPEPAALAQSPLIGLGRVIASECPSLRSKLIDLGRPAGTSEADAQLRSLVEELLSEDEHDEVALRGDARYCNLYSRSTGSGPAGVAASEEQAYRLMVSRHGTLDGLAWHAIQRRAPGQGEVEIRVAAAGLNFSDVLKALGLYPGLPDGPVPLGAECSGRVIAVGPGVTGLRVGDEVVAVGPFTFSSHLTTPAALVALKPAHMSFEEAATLPITFLTAAYALEYLGRLSPGERVLIHSATGGVGFAALQIARKIGTEVFATAGTPEKRDLLRAMGVTHVMDSRTLAFADEVMQSTGGAGVDVVLNSLSGEAISKGLSVLGDFGRFLEIGKRDIYKNTRLGLKPFRKNVTFSAIDLDRVMRQRPALMAGLFQKVIGEARDGLLAPLPHRVFNTPNVVSAFRYMQQGKHVGKVVLSLQDRPAVVVPAPAGTLSLRGDATYLVTGGLGGFGLGVAKWMIDRGARHLVLMGRRGIHSDEAAEAVAAMRQAGAEVVAMAADVSVEADVARVLAHIDAHMPPLRGVMHAAMHLEDGLLTNLDWAHVRRVVAPKVNGAWNLHTQTLDRSLDFFVLFSSLSSVFGIAGQANYAAANTFLDTLAFDRRSRGLPGLTINWGYLGGVGYVARHEKVGERLESAGVLSFTVRQALDLLERTLQQGAVQVGVMHIDWDRWRGLGVSGKVPPRFLALCKDAKTEVADNSGGLPGRRALLAAGGEQRRQMLQTLLRDKVAQVLGASPSKLDPEKPLIDLGLDSLMGVELRNWIEGDLQVSVPIAELMRSPSLGRLTDLLLEQFAKLDGPATAATVAPVAPSAVAHAAAHPHTNGSANGHSNGNGHVVDDKQAQELLARVDELPGEDVDAMLKAMLAEKE
jgi:NADPH:quinone reductase-like Zn-dependent oxidoreductase/SAM-dependent methyltransferase/NAD(P)-dependent dehydrogenase (short-subunit alcohol dehydrogenase family)/aryl carrier-like protein